MNPSLRSTDPADDESQHVVPLQEDDLRLYIERDVLIADRPRAGVVLELNRLFCEPLFAEQPPVAMIGSWHARRKSGCAGWLNSVFESKSTFWTSWQIFRVRRSNNFFIVSQPW